VAVNAYVTEKSTPCVTVSGHEIEKLVTLRGLFAFAVLLAAAHAVVSGIQHRNTAMAKNKVSVFIDN
jgi:hypothetical protein